MLWCHIGKGIHCVVGWELYLGSLGVQRAFGKGRIDLKLQ